MAGNRWPGVASAYCVTVVVFVVGSCRRVRLRCAVAAANRQSISASSFAPQGIVRAFSVGSAFLLVRQP